MEKPTGKSFVPRSAVDALRVRAAHAGLSVDRMAGELGLELPRAPQMPGIPLAGYLRLQTLLQAAADAQLGGTPTRPHVDRLTEFVLAKLPSRGRLIDAMETIARCYNTLHRGEQASVEQRVDVVAFIINDRSEAFADALDEDAFFSVETTLLYVHALLRLIVPSVAPVGWCGVELRRVRPTSSVPFTAHVETSYGRRRHALLYERATADRVTTFPAPGTIGLDAVTEEQIGLLEGGVDDRTFAGRVRVLIVEEAGDQASVARALGMSVATLRRRLVEEKTTFRTLRIETLTQQAEKLLRTSMPLVQVAERLSFSDVRSFSRAFKSWTGVTPNTRRKELEDEPSTQT
ncbi:MAG: helix-turn-helix transcriptional regulator [Pseudomonadota bacterium]